MMGTDDLYVMACDAEDEGKNVYVSRSEFDDEVIEWIEVDGEEFHNDVIDAELDDTDDREARRYYYG